MLAEYFWNVLRRTDGLGGNLANASMTAPLPLQIRVDVSQRSNRTMPGTTSTAQFFDKTGADLANIVASRRKRRIDRKENGR